MNFSNSFGARAHLWGVDSSGNFNGHWKSNEDNFHGPRDSNTRSTIEITGSIWSSIGDKWNCFCLRWTNCRLASWFIGRLCNNSSLSQYFHVFDNYFLVTRGVVHEFPSEKGQQSSGRKVDRKILFFNGIFKKKDLPKKKFKRTFKRKFFKKYLKEIFFLLIKSF